LFSYWRSSSAWRVRIALNVKGIKFTYHPVNLLKNEQSSEEYKKLNPLGTVPTLHIDGHYLGESFAILEYLEETQKGQNLLPKDPIQRAVIRQISLMVVSDCQPIQNMRVLAKVEKEFGEEYKLKWAKHWIENAFKAIELELAKTSGKYCFGDEVSLADCCLIPQVYNANRFGVDMKDFPNISKVDKNCSELEAFKKSHPTEQPDCQK